jgi:ZIP family zinc transporter
VSSTAIALGALSGVTLLLGLPFALLKSIRPKTRAFVTAMSTGILVFLLVEIAHHVIENIEDLTLSAAGGYETLGDTFLYSGIFGAGLFLGLMGLVWFEKRYMGAAQETADSARGAQHLALMIAIGMGLHNFGEGLAIGQAYGWGNTSLALLLVVGFGLHNATEGFGIGAPLAGHRVTWRFVGLLALIGGVPTIVGSMLGSLWTIKPLEIFCLSLASGSILYVIGELLHLGRKLRDEAVAASGLLVGFFLAFATEILIALASGGLGKS